MIQLKTHNILNGAAHLQVPPGQYEAFLLRVEAVSAAGDTLTAADMGQVLIRLGTSGPITLDWADGVEMNEMMLGEIEAVYGASGGNAIATTFIIPASIAGDGNVFDVTDEDNFSISVTLSGVSSTEVASGNLTLCGVLAEGIQQYIPNIAVQQANIAVSSTEFIYSNVANVSNIFLTNLTNIASILVKRDDEVIVQGTIPELRALSNADNRLESAYTTGIRLSLARSGSISESLSERVQVQVTTTSGGAATPHVIFYGHEFTAQLAIRSATMVNAKAQARLRKPAHAEALRLAQAIHS